MVNSSITVSFTPFDWFITMLFLIGLLAIGLLLLTQLKQKPSDFILGDENPPSYILTTSFFSFLSLIGFLSFINFGQNIFLTIFPIGVLIAMYLSYKLLHTRAIPFFYQSHQTKGNFSLYSLLEERFGTLGVKLIALTYVLIQMIRVTFILFLLKSTFNILPSELSKFILGIALLGPTLYLCVGGMRSYLWACFLQTGIILLFTLIGCIYFASKFHLNAHTTLFPFAVKSNLSTLTINILHISLISGLSFFIYQNYYIKYIISNNLQETIQALRRGFILITIGIVGFLILGIFARLFYDHSTSGAAPLHSRYDLWTFLLSYRFPAGIKGLLLILSICLTINTLIANLQGASVVIWENFYEPYHLKHDNAVSKKQSTRFLQSTTVGIGIFCLLFAFVPMGFSSRNTQQLFMWVIKPFDLLLVSMFMFWFIGKRLSVIAMIVGLLMGCLIETWTSFAAHYPIWCPLNEKSSFFISLIACCATSHLVYLARREYKISAD